MAFVALAFLGTMASPGWAQEFEPRTDAVEPPGLNSGAGTDLDTIAIGYQDAWGGRWGAPVRH
jgi:hypothetical protein